jgi:hypothetical protein
MTTTEGLTPKLYGATELGIVSFTATGGAQPRVNYVGGEVFVGLSRSDGAWVTEAEAEAWDPPFGDVLPRALAETTPDLVTTDGVLVIDDELVAATVLYEPARLADIDVKGVPVAWVLAPDTVVISGADDERGIAEVLRRAEELYAADARLVSIHPIALDGDEWTPYNWAAATEAQRPAISRVIRLFGVRGYERQAPVIRRPDVHVADPKIHVNEAGVTMTFAAWPKGTATLLPVTDNVMIADPEGTLSVATFDQFLDVMGDMVTKTGLSPTRFFVAGKKASA